MGHPLNWLEVARLAAEEGRFQGGIATRMVRPDAAELIGIICDISVDDQSASITATECRVKHNKKLFKCFGVRPVNMAIISSLGFAEFILCEGDELRIIIELTDRLHLYPRGHPNEVALRRELGFQG